MFAKSLIIFYLTIYSTESAILLWSKQKLSLPPLQQFTNDDLSKLIEENDFVSVTFYSTNKPLPLKEFKLLLKDFYTAYTPNDELDGYNFTDISDDYDFERIKNDTNSINNNKLFVLILNNERTKRQIQIEETSPESTGKPLTGPVLYRGKSKKDDLYTMIYSSKPLELKINNTVVLLGNTQSDMITVDTASRDAYTRLNVNVPFREREKLSLRFYFAWLNGYWSLDLVRIMDTTGMLSYNLTMSDTVVTPIRFSYHCTGLTDFLTSTNITDVVLTLTDMQYQVDSIDGTFGDAYDCVDFMTPPIWSGLFVSGLLGIGLILALVAINDIKTMDKFDNYKTKQLTVTVMGE